MHKKSARNKRDVVINHLAVALFVSLFVILGVLVVVAITSPGINSPGKITPPVSSVPVPTVVQPTPPLNPPPVVPTDKTTSGSFTDIFSGDGWIDVEKTTMYQDFTTSAFTLPPKFSWVERNNVSLNEDDYASGQDARCIKGRCLINSNKELYFDGVKLNLPSSPLELRRVSIGELGTKWMVGLVYFDGSDYRGRVFSFDGRNITRELSVPPIVSKQEAHIGVGGSDRDWIVLYGGNDGIAYRVTNGVFVEDLSHLFNPRVMAGGFYPVIIRANTSPRPTWYIYGLDRPKLVKLFQNNSEKVEGIIDYTAGLELRDFERVTFYQGKGAYLLMASTMSSVGGLNGVWEFEDLGFDNSSDKLIVSRDVISRQSQYSPRSARIKEIIFSDGGGGVDFYFSANGADWSLAGINKIVNIEGHVGDKLLWKAEINPNRNKYFTSFLKKITIDYNVSIIK